MVFHLREQNHVTGVKKFSAPRLRDQVDAFGRAAGEHDLVRAGRADKIGHALPRLFVMLGRTGAQCVQAAMHIGVFVFVIISDDIENRARFLRTGGVVEINQRMTVDALPQNRKFLAERGPIHSTSGCFVHKIICSMRWFAPVYSRVS